MEGYRVPRHVFSCVTDTGCLVLVDLKRARYLSFRGPQDSLCKLMLSASGAADVVPGDIGQDTLTMLRDEGLLTESIVDDADALPVTSINPGKISFIGEYDAAPAIRFVHVVNLAVAVVRAMVLWRLCSLERSLRVIARRKRKFSSRGEVADIERWRELARVFFYLRPYFYTSAGRCLFDSIVMTEFMHRHGLHPVLVLGVQASPFMAHSWVQEGEFVLNDTPERTRTLTPIVAI